MMKGINMPKLVCEECGEEMKRKESPSTPHADLYADSTAVSGVTSTTSAPIIIRSGPALPSDRRTVKVSIFICPRCGSEKQIIDTDTT